jgi:hypothetical protein
MTRFLGAILLVMPFLLKAQVVTVSEPITLHDEIGYHVLGSIKGQVLLLRDLTTSFEVEAFDQSLRQSWTKSLELDKFNPELLEAPGQENGFSVIYRYRKRGHHFLKIHHYDPAANLVDSATVKDLGSYFNAPSYELVLSENKKMALVFSVERLTQFHVMAIDIANMELLWETAYSRVGFTTPEDFREILVDNRGNMYLVFETENRKSQREKHQIEMLSYGPNFGQMTQTNVPMEEKLTFDDQFVFDNANGHLVGAGLYSDETVGRTAGYFYVSVNFAPKAEYVLAFHKFQEESISAMAGKSGQEGKGLTEMAMRELVLRRDGGVLLIAERTKIYERQSGVMTRNAFDRYNRFIVDYYFEDMVIATVHPDGNKHWEKVIHKKQYSQDDDAMYSSFFIMKSPQKLQLIFNDEIRNENTVSAYVISPEGNLARTSVFNTESQDLKLRFRDSVQVSGSEIIVPSERRSRLKLVRVSF